MPSPLRSYGRTVFAFVGTVFIVAFALALRQALAPGRNTHEFPEAWQSFLFGLVVWGGALNACISLGFAVGLAPTVREPSSLSRPVLVGAAAGLAACALAGTGVPFLFRPLPLVGPSFAGLLVGLSTSFLVLSASLVRRLRVRAG